MSHSSEGGSLKAILYALGANSGIAIAKFIGWLFTGSASMLAESIHSVSDCANQGLLLLGLKQAKAPVSDDHPLGEHRVVYFYSMIVALLLFFVGGAFSLYEGIHHILAPEPVKNAAVALVILAVSILLEGGSLFGALKEVKKERGDMTFLQWWKETRQSELLVVVGEDFAALGGLVFAFMAVALSAITGNPIFDAIGSCAVGILLMLVAYFVMVEVKGLITGESVTPQLRKEIRAFVEAQPEVEKVYNIFAMAEGANMWIALKVELKNDHLITGVKAADIVNEVEERIQKRFPTARHVFFEIDRDREKLKAA